jgi:predicted anti-sigma-YlaC factor YlaD
MMDCAGLRPLLGFYLEKETDPLETLEARIHLDSCSACRSRAQSLQGVMARCETLPQRRPARDIAVGVMGRLASLKRSAHARTLTAKWSGVAVILSAGLAALMHPAAPVMRVLGPPVEFLVGLVSGGSQDKLRDLVGSAGPFVPAAVSGALRPGLASGAMGPNVTLTIQLFATGLAFGLGLAIPVAVLTAWLLHREAASRSGR